MKKVLDNVHYLVFLLISFIAVKFNYVEGDDTSMIAYHILGRNSEIQPVYSPYHSMFDTLLCFLDNSEVFLRYSAVFISLVSSVFVYVLIGFLHKQKKLYNKTFMFLLPFIVPEMFFSGLYINPTIVSFCFILLSHSFLLQYFKLNKLNFLLLSILLFGLGTSIRWSNGFYLFVIAGEYLVYYMHSRDRIKNYLIGILHCVLFILSVILFIYISGYSLVDVYNVYTNGAKYMENKEYSIMSMIAIASSYITIPFLILFLLGIYKSIISKNISVNILVVISILPFFLLGFFPSYKYMITTFMVVVIVMAYGITVIQSKYFRIALYVFVFLPWVLGVKLYSNLAWGSGYELKNVNKTKIVSLESFNPDSSTKIQGGEIGFYGGFAMPTPEGPRPLGGYLWVLMDGYSSMVENINKQRENAVAYARQNRITILQDVRSSFLVTKLVEEGFKTDHYYLQTNEGYYTRTFTKENEVVEIIVPFNKKDLFKESFINSIKNKSNKFVLYSTYTNIITKLNTFNFVNFEQKNAYWGVLEIQP